VCFANLWLVYLLTSSVVRYVAVRSFPRTHYQRHTYSFIINKSFCHRFTISNVSVVATKYIILLNSFFLFRVSPLTYLYSFINIVLFLLPGVLYQITLTLSVSFFFRFSSTCWCPLCSFAVTFFQCSFRRTILGDFSWECLDFEIVAALSSPPVHATAACLACWQSFKRVSGTNYTGPSNNEFRTYNWMCRRRLHRAAFHVKCTAKRTGRGTYFLM